MHREHDVLGFSNSVKKFKVSVFFKHLLKIALIRIGKRRIVKRSHCEHRPPLHWDGQSWFWSSIAVRLASQFFVNPYTKLNVSQSRSWCVPRCSLSAGGATCTSEKPARIFRRGLCPPVCRPFLRQTGGRHNGHNGLNRHTRRTGTDRSILVFLSVTLAEHRGSWRAASNLHRAIGALSRCPVSHVQIQDCKVLNYSCFQILKVHDP